MSSSEEPTLPYASVRLQALQVRFDQLFDTDQQQRLRAAAEQKRVYAISWEIMFIGNSGVVYCMCPVALAFGTYSLTSISTTYGQIIADRASRFIAAFDEMVERRIGYERLHATGDEYVDLIRNTSAQLILELLEGKHRDPVHVGQPAE